MRHVDNQAVPADEIEDGNFAAAIPIEMVLRDYAPELVAELIEKDPRQDRKVVGREEIL